MTTTAWKRARQAAGKTTADVERHIREEMPESYWLDRSKITRFENGGSAKLDPVTLAVIAEFYGTTLSELDPDAAKEWREARDLVARTPGWVTANGGHTPRDVTGGMFASAA